MNLRNHQRRAFTLLELLIVAALCAVLLLLSFSVMGTVRTKSDAAKCLQNMKATGQAMILFFQDQNGAFFPQKSWFQYPSTRQMELKGMRDYFGIGTDGDAITSPVFKRDSILTCPAVKRLRPHSFEGPNSDPFHRGVAINIMLNAKQTNGNWGNTPWGERPAMPNAFLRMQAVERPSRMLILTETPFNGEALGSISEPIATEGKRYMLYPHVGDTQHALFLDGHIERLTEEQFKNPESKRAFWGDKSYPE